MKTKGHRIFGCLLLICAVGITIGVCATAANSKMPLSDNAMGSVYGGDGCGDCEWSETEGCSGSSNQTCAGRYDGEYAETCSGKYRTSCKYNERNCLGNNQNWCDPTSIPCPDTYDVYDCVLVVDACVTQDDRLDEPCSQSTPGTVDSCDW